MWNDFLREVLLPLFGALAGLTVTVGVPWAIALFQRKTGVEVDARMRDALQTAVSNAAGLLLNPKARGTLTIEDAVKYASAGAGDAIKHFGLTDAQVGQKINAKVGLVIAPAGETKP